MNSTSPGIPGFETHELVSDGVGAIVAARRRSDGRDVIIKLLDPASEPLLPRRFDRHHRKLLRLAQQGMGIVPVLDQGVASDGRHYLVLPRYRLGSLQDQIERGPTPWFPATRLLARVTEILGRATADGEAFGDIRPSKILLEDHEWPVVSVFGMASRRFDDGRPSYRAPEAGNDRPPTAASDVYSLSLVFGALISGQPKEPGESSEDFAARLVDLVPHRIFDVIEHGLTESPTNRYRSAAAMHRALQRASDGGPGSAVGLAHPTRIDRPEGEDETTIDLDQMLADLGRPGPNGGGGGDESGRRPTSELDAVVAVSAGSIGIDPPPEPSTEPSEDERPLPAGLDDIRLAPPRSASEAPVEPTTDPVLAPLDPDTTSDEEIVDLTELFTRTQEFVYDPSFETTDPTTMLAGGSGARSTDHPGPVIDLTESTDRTPFDRPTPAAAPPPTPPQMPASRNASPEPPEHDDRGSDHHAGHWPGQAVAPDDQTEIFADRRPGEPAMSSTATAGTAGTAPPPFMDTGRSEVIPFPNVLGTRPKNRGEVHPSSFWLRAELLWFGSRRTIATTAAVLGLAAIIAIVILVAAREIRSSSGRVLTEGAPTPLTTATSNPDFVATQAPFITDVPPGFDPEDVAPPPAPRPAGRRSTTAPSPAEQTTAGDGTASSSSQTTGTAETTETTGTTESKPASSATTTETTVTTIEETTTTKKRGNGRRPTTSEATTTTTVTTTTTTETTVLPTEPPTEPTIDDDMAAARQAATVPALIGPTLLSLSGSAATVAYSSDTCVATRFRLTGSDGSSQTDTSSAYDADIHCSTAWNLAFDGSSGLDPGVTYSLAVTVKNSSGLTSSRTLTFTTPD